MSCSYNVNTKTKLTYNKNIKIIFVYLYFLHENYKLSQLYVSISLSLDQIRLREVTFLRCKFKTFQQLFHNLYYGHKVFALIFVHEDYQLSSMHKMSFGGFELILAKQQFLCCKRKNCYSSSSLLVRQFNYLLLVSNGIKR